METTIKTPSFSDVPGQGRRQCGGCQKYIGVRCKRCPVCQADLAVQGPTIRTAMPKPPAKVVETSNTAGRGRKLCPACRLYIGVRTLVCACGNKDFQKKGTYPNVETYVREKFGEDSLAEAEAEITKIRAETPLGDGLDMLRTKTTRDGYFVFTNNSGVVPPGVYASDDEAHLAYVHFDRKADAIKGDLTLYNCETEELARTVAYGIVREQEKKIRYYLTSF